MHQMIAAIILACVMPGEASVAGPARAGSGDRLVMEGGRSIVLDGVVAPHAAQYCHRSDNEIIHCGRMAEDLLAQLVSGRTVRCTLATETTGVCRVGSLDLGEEMLRRGFAFPRRRGASARYARVAAAARAERRGLWQGRFVHPEEWLEARRRSSIVQPNR